MFLNIIVVIHINTTMLLHIFYFWFFVVSAIIHSYVNVSQRFLSLSYIFNTSVVVVYITLWLNNTRPCHHPGTGNHMRCYFLVHIVATHSPKTSYQNELNIDLLVFLNFHRGDVYRLGVSHIVTLWLVENRM